MTYAAIALAIALFCWGLHALRLVAASLEAVAIARNAAGVMRAPDLDDERKEAELQAAALRLFRLFGVIALKALVALAVPAAAVALLAAVGLVRVPEVLDASTSWPVIVVSTVVMAVALAVWRR